MSDVEPVVPVDPDGIVAGLDYDADLEAEKTGGHVLWFDDVYDADGDLIRP